MSFDLDFFKRNLTVLLDMADKPEQFFFGQFLREEKPFHWKMVPGEVSAGSIFGMWPDNCLQIGCA